MVRGAVEPIARAAATGLSGAPVVVGPDLELALLALAHDRIGNRPPYAGAETKSFGSGLSILSERRATAKRIEVIVLLRRPPE